MLAGAKRQKTSRLPCESLESHRLGIAKVVLRKQGTPCTTQAKGLRGSDISPKLDETLDKLDKPFAKNHPPRKVMSLG